MVLDQSTEGLSEVLGQIAEPLRQLESMAEVAGSAPSAESGASAEPVSDAMPQPPAGSGASAPVETAAAKVYDIAELGGREISSVAEEDEVYDLEHFGAVQL